MFPTITSRRRPGLASRGHLARERPGRYAPAVDADDPVVAAEAALAAARRAAGCDIDGLDAARARRLVTTARRLESAAAAVKATAVRAVQLAGVAEQDGAGSTTEWLADTLNMSGRDAKRQAELARKLSWVPDTREALKEGEIGEAQAAQIAEAAIGGRLGDRQAVEADLLEAARTSRPEDLRKRIRDKQQAVDGDTLLKDEKRARARRRTDVSTLDNGMVHIDALLDPLAGARFATALDALEAPDPPDTPPGAARTATQRRADALADMAEAALAHGAPPQSGGVKPQLSVLCPLETIADLKSNTPGETDRGEALSAEAVRRIACDATIRRIVVDPDTLEVNVGRRTSKWSAAQRAAIVARDGHCRFPGCTRPAAWSRIHHVWYWSEGGGTDYDNGVLLCDHHHHLVHEGGWTLTLNTETFEVTVISPSGRHKRRSKPDGLAARFQQVRLPQGSAR